MPTFDLIGDAYSLQYVGVSGSRLVNWYAKLIQSGHGPSAGTKFALFPRPGLTLFGTIAQSPIRCTYAENNRAFVVAGDSLYELHSDGTSTLIGPLTTIPVPTRPAKIISNGRQFLIMDGAPGTTAFNTWLWEIDSVTPPVPVISAVDITFIDGYFAALRPAGPDFPDDPVGINTENGTQVNISGIYDGASWDPLDYRIKAAASDQAVAILGPGSFNGGPQELWVMGKKTIEVWYDDPNQAAAALFPFVPIHGAFINTGVWAPASIVGTRLGVAFVAAADRGIGQVVRMSGYIPEPLSTDAIDRVFQSYAVAGQDTSDAIGYTYQEDGEEFYVITFPTADKTWAVNLQTKLWHQRSSIIDNRAQTGLYHMECFGKHLLGDQASGNIYIADLDIQTDNGSTIPFIRVSQHTSNEDRWFRVNKCQLSVALPFAVNRQYDLQISRDGQQTFGNVHSIIVGPDPSPVPQSQRRVVWRQLGRCRDFVIQISTIAANPIIDGYVSLTPGTEI